MPQLRGSQHPRAKLTEQQAEYIRTVYAPGIVTMRELAEETGVHVSTVCAVLQGRTWNEAA